MITILIPTDFSIKSLKLINCATQRFADRPLHIILVHAIEPDHSIGGLLMLNKRLDVHRLYSAEFLEACEVLRNKYASQIHKIRIEFYYGSTKAYLKNFLQARNIEAILLPSDYKFNTPSPASRDGIALWQSCALSVYTESIQATIQTTAFSEEQSLSELLHA
jgi:hypothetical protein